ncbi:amino acid permease/ SLC12A domain-containing protein [Phyllosticta citrichinensis]|uniref:Amino acid permease/ SLC12A domain-containing protein n=1 Tax=Phyllosticta citrichinensis TaxID=1130410 RepID=A0ABR1XG73_9PEZI
MSDSPRIPRSGSPDQKGAVDKAGPRVDFEEGDVGNVQSGHVDASDHTHRRLKPRHIQLIGIAGTIGTALFVNIGKGLLSGGPASLFIAYCLWCPVILAISLCMSEMATYLPVSSPFIRFAGRFVDEAFGVAAGYNFFLFQASLLPFEITVCNVVIRYWTDAIPVWAVCLVFLSLYAILNFVAVKFFGEAEFWLSLGKVVLIVGLISYTFVVMVGGNPRRDAFGFRYWDDPDAFRELYREGSLGRFLGFLYCLIQAAFVIAGPEYVSMTAGEAENPRKVLPKAYRSIFWRLTTFFVLGSLAAGIVVPSDEPKLKEAYSSSKGGAAGSPYVRSIFRAGNSTTYCATRTLYGMALEGKAPRLLAKCNNAGVPYYSVAVVLCFGGLSFLQVSNSTAVVLNWFVSLVTASQLINFCVIAFTYTRFMNACGAQGISRDSLPYKAPFQPYTRWFAFACCSVMTIIAGYSIFIDDNFTVPDFLFQYMMVGVFPVVFVLWKVIKKTKWLRPAEVDLTTGVWEIDVYTENFVPTPSKTAFTRALDKIFS